jgi:hypothetical protein
MVHQVQELLLTLGWPSLRMGGYNKNETKNCNNGPFHSADIVREKLLLSAGAAAPHGYKSMSQKYVSVALASS